MWPVCCRRWWAYRLGWSVFRFETPGLGILDFSFSNYLNLFLVNQVL